MNDDRRDPNDPASTPGADRPGVPAVGAPSDLPPPPVTPSQPGAAPLPPPPQPAQPSTPADYYAQPPATADSRSGCKKWLIGCGAAGCLVGILLIVGVLWVMKSGWPMLMSRMVTEVQTHIADHGESVDPSVREELDIELTELKRHISEGDVDLQDMQGFVYSMQDIVGDDEVTTLEAEEFLEEVRRVNEKGSSGEF